MREPDDAKVSCPILRGDERGDAPLPTQQTPTDRTFMVEILQNNSPNFAIYFAKSH